MKYTDRRIYTKLFQPWRWQNHLRPFLIVTIDVTSNRVDAVDEWYEEVRHTLLSLRWWRRAETNTRAPLGHIKF
jgi:hypothetical protein